MVFECIDAHVHSGKIAEVFEEYLLKKVSNIKGAVVFSHVAGIYNRKDPNFKDNPGWQDARKKSNEYVLNLSNNQDFKVFPFFFVWNDFCVDELGPYLGVKWHRHWGEPKYDYTSQKCKIFVEEIKRRNLPVILEEESKNTMEFINGLGKDLRIIIPHLGMLNGGYEIFDEAGIWSRQNIYADTALASQKDIVSYLGKYGHERLMFGSDFPFGEPREELEKILSLDISPQEKNDIICQNVLKMLSENKAG